MLLVCDEYKIQSLTPHVQHNGQLADPTNRYAAAMKEITSKKKKTTADYEALEDLEWEGSLYLNADQRVVVPGTSIVGALSLAGRKTRDGATVRNAVISDSDWLLEYDGPKQLAKLKADPNHRLRVSVVIPANKSRVMRTRPIFRNWNLTFRVRYRPDIINPKDLEGIVSTLGSDVGLSDDRKLMGGRFEIVSRKEIKAAN